MLELRCWSDAEGSGGESVLMRVAQRVLVA